MKTNIFVKEHAYSKKRRVFNENELNYRTIHLFNECEYSVCTVWNSNQQPIESELNVVENKFQYEGFVHFKKTFYVEAYRTIGCYNSMTFEKEPIIVDRY